MIIKFRQSLCSVASSASFEISSNSSPLVSSAASLHFMILLVVHVSRSHHFAFSLRISSTSFQVSSLIHACLSLLTFPRTSSHVGMRTNFLYVAPLLLHSRLHLLIIIRSIKHGIVPVALRNDELLFYALFFKPVCAILAFC